MESPIGSLSEISSVLSSRKELLGENDLENLNEKVQYVNFEITNHSLENNKDTNLNDIGITMKEDEDEIEPTENSPWLRNMEENTLPEFHGRIPVPESGEPWYRSLWHYLGPGTLIAVGYMDPGNWSTDLAGGSAFGYSLLFIIALSSAMAIFLQYLSLKAGLATNRDLAQICRDSYPRPVVIFLWIVMEIAICATDLAEVLGSAIALKLLFGLPLIAGVCITAFDVLLVLCIHGRRFDFIEKCVALLILIILVCFTVQLGYSKPDPIAVLWGFLPSAAIFSSSEMFVAVGIIGATVMPHNLFLHSSIILTREIPRHHEAIQEAIRYGAIDSAVALSLACFINAAILIVSAATFYRNGYNDIATLEDAYQLLEPILHSSVAPILFGIALLAAGQNSTLTGTLTGQIVMEGFMSYKLSPAFRRVFTRLLAILPAIIITTAYGDTAANDLLIISQVVLSFCLPFAIIPLTHITASKSRMGRYVNNPITTAISIALTLLIICLNIISLV